MDKVDYLIIGQGISGTCLALHLLEKGKSIKIIDNGYKSSSTVLAAGMINPITGRKYVKSWLIDTLLEYAKRFYSQCELQFGEKIQYPTTIKRNMPNIQAVNDWMARCQDDAYVPYVEAVSHEAVIAGNIYSEFGFATIKNALRIDLALLLQAAKASFIRKNIFQEEDFNYNALVLGDCLQYKNLKADRVIFCEGYKVDGNPFFNTLPFAPVKGEVVELLIPDLELDFVLRHERFLIPLGRNKYWTGGGYEKQDLTQEPTKYFMDKLLNDLDGFLQCPYEVLSHRAGVRPAVRDRKPILGAHIDYANVYICNGMGTKGASLAPYFTHHLVEHLEHGQTLNPSVDIQRFQ